MLFVYMLPLATSCCIRRINVVLTWFQAEMYFSMHWLTHVCSLLEMEEPGFGMQLLKQCWFIFCLLLDDLEARLPPAPPPPSLSRFQGFQAYINQLPSVARVGLDQNLLDDGLLDSIRVHVAGRDGCGSGAGGGQAVGRASLVLWLGREEHRSPYEQRVPEAVLTERGDQR